MWFKSIFRGLGETSDHSKNKSRRQLTDRSVVRGHGRSHIAPESVASPSAFQESCWVNLPPELLLDIIQRLEANQTFWPARRDVVACAAVCKSWRATTKEVVRSPERCGLLTFPISLKQPGPRDSPIQCFIKRERATSTYLLHLGLSPGDASKVLLAARRFRRAANIEFRLSLAQDDFSAASSMYIGKLRSNFLGTKFIVYDDHPPCVHTIQGNSSSYGKVYSKEHLSSRIPANYNVATISYELNVLRSRGPRRMLCTIHSIPVSAIQEGGTAPTPSTFESCIDEQCFPSSVSKGKSVVQFGSSSPAKLGELVHNPRDPLILKNKAPRWNEQLQCWCLNFRGRVTMASVKNFQLVAAVEQCQNVPVEEQEKVILQFGKIGEDIFTMDYCYPLSAFQAFAICLSSFDTKPEPRIFSPRRDPVQIQAQTLCNNLVTGVKMLGLARIVRSCQETLKLATLRNCLGTRSPDEMKKLFSRCECVTSSPAMQQKGLENTTVAEVLTTKGEEKVGSWLWCRSDDTVHDAVKHMAQHNVGSLVVLKPGEQQLIAGIITERDYLRKVVAKDRAPKYTRVLEIMTDQHTLITVTSDTNIVQAMKLMTENHIRHVPVIDGKIVGMISLVDIVRAVVEQQSGEVKRLKEFIKGEYF